VSGFTEKGSKGKVEMWCSKIYEERKRSSFCLYKKETGPFAYLTMAQTEKEKTLGGYSRACVNCTVEVSSCNKAYQNVTRIRPTNCGGKAYGEKVDTTHKDLVLDHRPSAGAVMTSASFRYLSSDLEVGLTNLLVESGAEQS
jgi:hypothetical protein